MKKLLYSLLMILTVILLSGCTDTLFYTNEYNSYSYFAKQNKIGIKKQKILDKFGYPDAYLDTNENYQSIPYTEREDYKDELFSSDGYIWSYDCCQLPDPANPYRLQITFDENGKSIANEFDQVPGG